MSICYYYDRLFQRSKGEGLGFDGVPWKKRNGDEANTLAIIEIAPRYLVRYLWKLCYEVDPERGLDRRER